MAPDIHVKSVYDMFTVLTQHQLCYGGVASGSVAFLACLKCNRVMHEMREFVDHGPGLGQNHWFCRDHAIEFRKQVQALRDYAHENKQDFNELYEKALKPLREVERLYQEQPEAIEAQKKGVSWVYLH